MMTNGSAEGTWTYFMLLHLGIVAPFLEIAPRLISGKRQQLVAMIDLSEKLHGAVLSVATVVMSWVTVFALMHYLNVGGWCLYDFVGTSYESNFKKPPEPDDPSIAHWWNYAYFVVLIVFYGCGVTVAEYVRVRVDFSGKISDIWLGVKRGIVDMSDKEPVPTDTQTSSWTLSHSDSTAANNGEQRKEDGKVFKAAVLFGLGLLPQIGSSILPHFSEEARRYETDYCPGQHQLKVTSMKLRDEKCAQIYQNDYDRLLGKRADQQDYLERCGDYMRNRATQRCYWCDEKSDEDLNQCSSYKNIEPPSMYLSPDWKCIPGLGSVVAQDNFAAFSVLAASFAFIFAMGWGWSVIKMKKDQDEKKTEEQITEGPEAIAPFVAVACCCMPCTVPWGVMNICSLAIRGSLPFRIIIFWVPSFIFLVILGLHMQEFWTDLGLAITLNMQVPEVSLRAFNFGVYVYGMSITSRLVVIIGCELTRRRLEIAEMRINSGEIFPEPVL